MADFSLPNEGNLREAWVRVMKDSRVGGNSGFLPSEAASLVGEMFGVSSLVVLLAVGSEGRQAVSRPTPRHPMTNPSSADTTGLREEIARALAAAEGWERLDRLRCKVGLRRWENLDGPIWHSWLDQADAVLAGPILASLSERLKAAEAERDEVWRYAENLEQIASGKVISCTCLERDAAEARASSLAQSVEEALTEACRMDAILLMAGEMTAGERRTAKAVADGIAAKVRSALGREPGASSLAEENERLREALRPFAKYAEHCPGLEWGEGEIGEYYHAGLRVSITSQDLRAAHSALTQETTDAQG